MDVRLETILTQLTRKYAPELPLDAWQAEAGGPARAGQLATALAGYNVLVMSGDAPDSPAETAADAVTEWVQAYVELYDLLARALFPSFTRVAAYYADSKQPPLVYLEGSATPVMLALAGYVAPYLASRRGQPQVSDFELIGLMNILLDELEAGDLPYEAHRRLRDEGVALLRRLLAARVRQRPLTAPRRALGSAFDIDVDASMREGPRPAPGATVPLPPSVPEAAVTAPPDVLPEQDAPARRAPADEGTDPLTGAIPIFYEPRSRGRRRPPVPDLPDLPE